MHGSACSTRRFASGRRQSRTPLGSKSSDVPRQACNIHRAPCTCVCDYMGCMMGSVQADETKTHALPRVPGPGEQQAPSWECPGSECRCSLSSSAVAVLPWYDTGISPAEHATALLTTWISAPDPAGHKPQQGRATPAVSAPGRPQEPSGLGRHVLRPVPPQREVPQPEEALSADCSGCGAASTTYGMEPANASSREGRWLGGQGLGFW